MTSSWLAKKKPSVLCMTDPLWWLPVIPAQGAQQCGKICPYHVKTTGRVDYVMFEHLPHHQSILLHLHKGKYNTTGVIFPQGIVKIFHIPNQFLNYFVAIYWLWLKCHKGHITQYTSVKVWVDILVISGLWWKRSPSAWGTVLTFGSLSSMGFF